MAIRFKFRSSVSFDSVDIEGRPSISVREFRSKIIRHKNLNLCQDFDLVFSDALTGRDYEDESFQIPSNSSVIIKRVPAGSVPSALPIGSVEKLGMKNSNIFGEKSGEMDDFDDFGIDLCPVPEEISPFSDLEVDKKNESNNEKTNVAGERLGCQKLQASGISVAIPGGSNHSGAEGNIPQKKLELKVEGHMKFGNARVVGPSALAAQNTDLPSELKCSLCNAFFKEAVMIPCCQHSFCEKCIRGVLTEKAKCPKCSSCKFRVEDLLPNLSLRQAIEHFLESQNLVSASENALREYAPDGESGIQAKDFSCAVTIAQKRQGYPLSPSVTEKGSNQLMGESFCAESLIRKNASLEGSGYHINNLAPSKVLKTVPSFHNIKKTSGERDGNAHHLVSQSGPGYPPGIEFQGENELLHFPQYYLHEEGGGRSFPAAARHRKADRTCYMCGAPDHFIRECPYAASPHPMRQSGNTMYPGGMPGFASPYWSGTTFVPPMRPFNSMYGNLGMMPFNASVVPVAPFGVSPYMSSMYGHFPVPGGRMGILASPVGNRAEKPLTNSEFLELRDCENRGKLSNEYLMRRQPCDDEDEDFQKGARVPAGSHGYKSHIVREKSGSYSGDNHAQRSRRKHHQDKHLDHDLHSVHDQHGNNSPSSRDRRPYHSERSNSGVEDVSNSSDRYDDGRYKQHIISRKHHERKGHCGSDSSWSRHQRQKEKDVKSRDYDEKGFDQKRGSQLVSGVELSSSGDQKQRSKERDHSRGSRHSRDDAKRSRRESCDDRWKMITPDEDCREGNRHPKRKRIH